MNVTSVHAMQSRTVIASRRLEIDGDGRRCILTDRDRERERDDDERAWDEMSR